MHVKYFFVNVSNRSEVPVVPASAPANVRPTGVKSIQIFGAFDTAPVTDSDCSPGVGALFVFLIRFLRLRSSV